MKRHDNPRYLEYCRAMGRTDPEEQMEADEEKFPGGCMTGFILWIHSASQAFCELYGPQSNLWLVEEWDEFLRNRGPLT